MNHKDCKKCVVGCCPKIEKAFEEWAEARGIMTTAKFYKIVHEMATETQEKLIAHCKDVAKE